MSNGLNIVSADWRVGRANHKIVIEVMHEILNVIVGLQEPLKGAAKQLKRKGEIRKPKGRQRLM